MRAELQEIAAKFANTNVNNVVNYMLDEDNDIRLNTMKAAGSPSWFIIKGPRSGEFRVLSRTKSDLILNPSFSDIFEFRFQTAQEALEAYDKYLDKIQNQ